LLALLAVAGTGLSILSGGIFPIPDPRHGGHASLLIAMLALPFVLSFALWRLGVSWAIKAYLVATIVLLLVMLPIMMRMIDIDMHTYAGLVQRIFALTVLVPIAVAAYELARRIVALRASGHQTKGFNSVDPGGSILLAAQPTAIPTE
jgi:hypothetical protein